MLSKKQRRSVARVLTVAYYKHRDLPLLEVCRKNRLRLVHDPEDAFGGSFQNFPEGEHPVDTVFAMSLPEDELSRRAKAQEKERLFWNEIYRKYRGQIEIPGKRTTPPDYKEYVFWHEFCHYLLNPMQLMSRLIGYQGSEQKYGSDAEDYWTQERLCEAFADAMLLYRRKVISKIEPNLETFLFEDTYSIGHAEAARFCSRRIQKYVDEAEAAKRNIDLRSLKNFLVHQEVFIVHSTFQPRLPTAFYEHHQNPGPWFVDEGKDLELTCAVSKNKESWRKPHPEEQRLVAEMRNILEETSHAQLLLFEEMAQADRDRLVRRVERLDKAAIKFQKS